MGHFWWNCAAALLMGAAYAAMNEARRRWGPSKTVPAGGSRAGSFPRGTSGAVLFVSALVLFAIALNRLMPYDNWAFIAGLVIGIVTRGSLQVRPQP